MGSGAYVSIPDPARLVEAVLEGSTGKDSFLHGEGHWRRVAAAGLALLPETPDADPAVVFLFALFHDSMRLNDGRDPQHGPRGAALAGKLRGEAFDLEDDEMGLLRFACEEHTNGGVASDPTVGACWDADRLKASPGRRWSSLGVSGEAAVWPKKSGTTSRGSKTGGGTRLGRASPN